MLKKATAAFIVLLLSYASVWAADPPDAPAPPNLPAAATTEAAQSDPATAYLFADAEANAKQADVQASAVDALVRQLDEVQQMDAAVEAQYGPNSQRVQNLRQQMKVLQAQLQKLSSSVKGTLSVPINVTFLGVGAEPVGEALGQQLQLQPGFGLMVQAVTPNSPAEAADIKKYDVLTKLDDQLLIAPAQLETLVRSHKSGDEISMTLIHAGQTSTVTAKLTTSVAGGPVRIAMPAKVRLYFDKSNSNIDKLNSQTPGPFVSSSIALNDGHYAITLDDKNHLKAVEAATGKVLFDGPVATDEQRQSVPQEVQPLLKQITEKQHAISIQPSVDGMLTFASTQPAEIITAGKLTYSPNGGGTVTMTAPPIQANPKTLVWANGTHALVLTMTDGKPTHLLVMGAGGKTLFDGPVETTERQAAIPAELRDGFDFLVQHPDAGHPIGN
jgi:hypothetical protein